MHLVSFCVVIIIFTYSDACFNWKEREPAPQLKFGKITITKKSKNVVFHTYSSNRETNVAVDTHIIELPNKLVLFDSQFTFSIAREVLSYAKYLDKPIDSMYISHYHPDHCFGLAVFQNVTKVYALPETILDIKINSQRYIDLTKDIFPNDIPDKAILPDSVVQDGEEKLIDDVLFQFKKLTQAETNVSLVVKIPSEKTVLVGDFVYNKYHLLLNKKQFDDWINALKQWRTDLSSYDLVLLGHLKPAEFDVFKDNIEYLETVKTVLTRVKTFDEFRNEMIRLFPQYTDPSIFDLAKPVLFPNEV